MKHCLLRSSTDQTNRTQATQPQLGEHESNRLVYQEPSLHNHREKTYVRPDIRERAASGGWPDAEVDRNWCDRIVGEVTWHARLAPQVNPPESVRFRTVVSTLRTFREALIFQTNHPCWMTGLIQIS